MFVAIRPTEATLPTELAMRFEIRYFDVVAGSTTALEVEAQSAAAAHALGSASGRVVLGVRSVRQTTTRSRLDVSWWCRELRTLVGAGMTVIEALETLSLQRRDGDGRQAHGGLLEALRRGRSLSDAMVETGGFPLMLVAGVRAGERTGGLISALDEFLAYDDAMQSLRRKATAAAVYPTVVLAVGLLIAALLMVFVVPRFAGLYDDSTDGLSAGTRAVVWLSETLRSQAGWWAAGAITAMVTVVWLVRVKKAGPLLACAAEHVPWTSRALWDFRSAQLYRSLAMMYRGGFPLDDALTHCRGLGAGALMNGGIDVAVAALRQGRSVSAAMSAGALTDAVSLRLLAVGERTGSFDRVLETIGERHAVAFAAFLDRSARLIEPLMLLAVASLVGGLVIMMYMPVFDIAGTVR